MANPAAFTGPATPVRFRAGQADAAVSAALAKGDRVTEKRLVYLDGLGTEAIIVGTVSAADSRAFAVLATGDTIEYVDLRAQEEAAMFERFGLMTPALWSIVSELDSEADVEFTILVTGAFVEPELPFDGTDQVVSQDEYRAWVTDHRLQQRDAIAAMKAPVRDWLLGGGSVIEADYEHLPMLLVHAPAALLVDPWLHAHPSVARIREIEDLESELLGYAGHASMSRQGGVPGDPDIQQLQGGVCGSGGCVGGFTAVGMWEDEPGSAIATAIANANDRFAATTPVAHYQVLPKMCTSDADCDVDCCGANEVNQQRCREARVVGRPPTQKHCVEEHLSHTSASVGMVGGYTYPAGSQDELSFTQGAGTWDVEYYVGNSPTTDYTLGFNYLIDSPLTYVNRSASGVGAAVADLIDWAFRSDLTFTTLAAGNSGSVTGCAHAWSGICVGAYNYWTYNDTSTHVRRALSSYLNQAASSVTLERPHMIGPGAWRTNDGLFLPDIRSTGAAMVGEGLYSIEDYPLIDGALWGTSFAAPAALSIAIQAHQYEGWFSNLAHPIVKKAVLLASTVDSNGDGPVNMGTTWTVGTGATDGQDGAGHILRGFVKQVLDANQYKYKSLSGSDFVFCGFRCAEYVAATVTVPANKALKVALSWNACATSRGASSDLLNNLNLYVTRPAVCGGNNIVSAAVQSEIEMIHDSCLVGLGQSGVYTIRIRMPLGGVPQNCGTGTGEPIGLAWSFQ